MDRQFCRGTLIYAFHAQCLIACLQTGYLQDGVEPCKVLWRLQYLSPILRTGKYPLNISHVTVCSITTLTLLVFWFYSFNPYSLFWYARSETRNVNHNKKILKRVEMRSAFKILADRHLGMRPLSWILEKLDRKEKIGFIWFWMVSSGMLLWT
jgi:hypothetical protein